MQILGANPKAEVVGLDPLPGKVNYYLGNDPAVWRAGISTYAQVVYRDIYPGIDLLYHSCDGQLEYAFELAPGMDPAAISLALTGADNLAIDAQGDLVVNAAGTQLRQHKPLLYQDVNGTRQAVAGNFVLGDGQRVGFQVGAYDRSEPLVI